MGGRSADTARTAERRRRAVSPRKFRHRHGNAGACPRHELRLRPLGAASLVAPRLRRGRSLALAAGRCAQGAAASPTSLSRLRRAAVAATVRLPAGNVRAYSVHFETVYGLWNEGTGATRRARCWPMRPHGGGRSRSRVIQRPRACRRGRQVRVLLADPLARRPRDVFDFDHVLVCGLCATGNRPAAHAPDVTGASDHRPVWAIVRPCETF